MTSKKMLTIILQKILQSIDEGIHVVDNEGHTILYNNSMAELEGMEIEDVMGKTLLDVFPSLNHDTSTLLKVLDTQEAIVNQSQTYLNNKGNKITTINTTIPLYFRDKKIGALEIAKNITKIKNLSEEIVRLQQQLNTPVVSDKKEKRNYTFDSLKGKGDTFVKAINTARKAAATSSSVLLFGETGTGKELFAQSIHYHSQRKDKPFIAQNCAALPESLLEGILFGTTKGSFTGAIDRPGLFEQANQGTLLLDEINSMGMQLQAKLLRVLQEGYVRRIGGLKDIPVDVRIIATTNEDPMEAIENAKIRKDLYYRLSVVNITVPSLRDRKEDILPLTEHFINYFNGKLGKEVWMISSEMREHFMHYHWPGNVRELENVIEGAMNMIQDEHILKDEHFPEYLLRNERKHCESLVSHLIQEKTGLKEVLEEIEKEYITRTMEKHNGNISRAAEELSLKRQTLQHKLKKLNIN
ncbi:sigma-54 interaction domain-containing protein [Alkaliphilus hydrothermalis]|uniref:Arginine utilization regulatory protein n=1 Tax=Alkaliphilus hydrothermalis TaxID=1482730 RepID=A0ABS2NLV7_9FIRM|nr:sigma 54-interacting transcriptional regulator [Alkaliphilus hydrothermalis]MBM7613909.1 arginine utilization regulatory protein [Alkaliphilus hydrothermalis]